MPGVAGMNIIANIYMDIISSQQGTQIVTITVSHTNSYGFLYFFHGSYFTEYGVLSCKEMVHKDIITEANMDMQVLLRIHFGKEACHWINN